MVSPELLVADEPTSMLDASLRVTVLNLLKDLRDQHHMTILFITHDLGQAYYVSDRVLVMYQGQLVEQGPVEQVLRNPQHDYTKRLMADVPPASRPGEHAHERILSCLLRAPSDRYPPFFSSWHLPSETRFLRETGSLRL